MNSSRSIFLGLDLNIVMNQEPLTTLRNRSSQKNGHTDIVDLSCNAGVRFPVLSSDGSCLEGVHARDVDFLRDRNRPFEISGALFDQLNPDRQHGFTAS